VWRQVLILGAFGKCEKRPPKARRNFRELDADGLDFMAVDHGVAVADDPA